jgi:hypothetical protein
MRRPRALRKRLPRDDRRQLIRRAGVRDVWILVGGIAAWEAASVRGRGERELVAGGNRFRAFPCATQWHALAAYTSDGGWTATTVRPSMPSKSLGLDV